jgi:hypothetical protein
LFKQVAQLIGAEIVSGICEIFPGEVRPGSLPYGIRAPGTWNPKSDSLGLIAHSSISPLLAEARREKKEYPFLYHATNRENDAQLHDRRKLLYRGVGGEWKVQFAITQPSTRRNQLKGLVHHIFRQVGREVARRNAEAQYNEATSRARATLPEHLSEFDALWDWTTAKWCAELTDGERQLFARLSTETERDAFRILRGFARKAIDDQSRDFPLSVQHVAVAIGVCHQAISKLRKRFAAFGIIEKTADHIVNHAAARFRWLLPGRVL